MNARRAVPWGIALLAAIVIAPTFASGWMGDDAFYSNLDGQLGADRSNLAAAIARAFNLWFVHTGRIYPLLILEKYSVFAAFTNLFAYKLFLIGMTLAALETFRRTAAAYANPSAANLAALCAATLLVQRGYHDATLAYNAMPQCAAILFFGALWLFRESLAPRGRGAVLAACAYAAAALTYEAIYPLALVFPIAARFVPDREDGAERPWLQALRRGLPFLAIACALTAAGLIGRALARVPADSLYAFGTSGAAIARTAAIQAVAPWPLSYWLFDPSGIYSRAGLRDFYNNAPLNPVLFAAIVALAWLCLRDAVSSPSERRAYAWIGFALAVLPALSIAPLLKYQHELKLGLGYLPVFFSLFGVALVLASCILWLRARFSGPRLAAALALAIAVNGTMTQATNRRLAGELHPAAAARAALEGQLDAGLLEAVPDGATVSIDAPFDWIRTGDNGPDGIATRGLFFAHGGKRVTVVDPQSAPQAVLTWDAATGRWNLTRPALRRP